MPWKAGYQINWITPRGSDFCSELERVSGRRAFSPVPCFLTLLIVVMSCGNGASDFNVVFYVMCFERCVLDCMSTPESTHRPPSACVRGRVKRLFTL